MTTAQILALLSLVASTLGGSGGLLIFWMSRQMRAVSVTLQVTQGLLAEAQTRHEQQKREIEGAEWYRTDNQALRHLLDEVNQELTTARSERRTLQAEVTHQQERVTAVLTQLDDVERAILEQDAQHKHQLVVQERECSERLARIEARVTTQETAQRLRDET